MGHTVRFIALQFVKPYSAMPFSLAVIGVDHRVRANGWQRVLATPLHSTKNVNEENNGTCTENVSALAWMATEFVNKNMRKASFLLPCFCVSLLGSTQDFFGF